MAIHVKIFLLNTNSKMGEIAEYVPAIFLLKSVSVSTGIPVNQLTFLCTQVFGLILAPVMRVLLNPETTSPAARQIFSIVSGCSMAVFAYGPRALHLLTLAIVCYVIIRTQSPATVQRIALTITMLYLSFMHLDRLFRQASNLILDICGPVMVLTQKTTSLAFGLHDGQSEKLSSSQKRLAIHEVPSLLEYFSYVLHFQTLMAGPNVSYRDYGAFIDGSSTKEAPSPVFVATKKIMLSLFCAILFVIFSPSFDIKFAKEEEFFELSFWNKFYFLAGCITVIRFKYYHAWILADGICNLSGLGFGGYGPDGTAKWDLVTNVGVKGVELGVSPRESIAHWNRGTHGWLRYTIYDRADAGYRTPLTFIFSAIWHGFYPGYYITFLSGVMVTLAARVGRRHIRPMFQNTRSKRIFYDALTFLITRIAMVYCCFSFLLLEFWVSIRIYAALYFWFHILGLLIIFFVPLITKFWGRPSTIHVPKLCTE